MSSKNSVTYSYSYTADQSGNLSNIKSEKVEIKKEERCPTPEKTKK